MTSHQISMALPTTSAPESTPSVLSATRTELQPSQHQPAPFSKLLHAMDDKPQGTPVRENGDSASDAVPSKARNTSSPQGTAARRTERRSSPVGSDSPEQENHESQSAQDEKPLQAAVHFLLATLWQSLPHTEHDPAMHGEESSRIPVTPMDGGLLQGSARQGLQQLLATLADRFQKDSASPLHRLGQTGLPRLQETGLLRFGEVFDGEEARALRLLSRELAVRPLQDAVRPASADQFQELIAHAADMDNVFSPQASARGQGDTNGMSNLTDTNMQLADWLPALKEVKPLQQLGDAFMATQSPVMPDLHDLGMRLLAAVPEVGGAASWQNRMAAALPWEGGMSAALPVPIQNIAWLSGPQGGIQGLQLQTHIAQLGDVMVRIDMLDGIRRIQLSADNLASAHALSLSAPRLEQQLAQAGLQDVRVQVGINSHSSFASFGQHGAADQGRHGQGGGVADLGIALHEAAGGALEQISPQISLTGPHAVNLLA